MLKILVLFLGVFAFCCGQSCYTVSPQTPLCSFLANANITTDYPDFNIMETTYNSFWPAIQNAITTSLNHYHIPVCQNCITAIQEQICLSLVPECGFLNCLSKYATNISNCYVACSSQSCSSSSLSSGSSTTACLNCLYTCYSNTILQPCGQYMLDRTVCARMINICGCGSVSSSDIDLACSFFSTNGRTFSNLPTLTPCPSTFCTSSSSSNGFYCPNNGMCMSPSQSFGGEAANPVVTNSGSGTSESNVIEASLSLLIALVGFLLF